MFITGILAFLFVLGLIILIHELGHFYFAKRAGVLCHEFSIGMGPLLWSTKRGDTQYSIRLIPFGGYVMMAGEDQDTSMIKPGNMIRLVIENGVVKKIVVDLKNKKYSSLDIVKVLTVDLYGKEGDLFVTVDEDGEHRKYTCDRDGYYVLLSGEMQFSPFEKSMESKTKWERFLAIFGGPLMNFLLAIVAFFIVGALTGVPTYDEPTVGYVAEDSVAEMYGFEEGMTIVSIDGKIVENWEEISVALEIQDSYEISYLIDETLYSETITPKFYIYSAGFASDYTRTDALILAVLSDDTLAGRAGLEIGDELTKIDGTEVSTWVEVTDTFNRNVDGTQMTLTVIRDGEELDYVIEPYGLDVISTQGVGLVDSEIGISPESSFSLVHAFTYAFAGTWDSVLAIRDTLSLLVSNDQVGVDDLAGPVGIYTITSRLVDGGIVAIISWLGLLSVNIGVLNLLPIPALDGGRLVFLGIEALTGRRVNRNIENRIHTLMYFALLAFLAYVTWNDLLRLFNLK